MADIRSFENTPEAGFGDFVQLLKPRVMSLVVFTALVGLLVAPNSLHPVEAFAAILFIALGAGASGSLNMWWDADIDVIMRRTQSRPVPSGMVTAGEALAANAARMNAVFAALKRAGIADKDIQTSNLSLSPIYTERVQVTANGNTQDIAPRIIGYTANNSVAVRQRKLSEVGRVIDALVAAGANEISGPDFGVDQPEAALDEARTAAMKAARARAALASKTAARGR